MYPGWMDEDVKEKRWTNIKKIGGEKDRPMIQKRMDELIDEW